MRPACRLGQSFVATPEVQALETAFHSKLLPDTGTITEESIKRWPSRRPARRPGLPANAGLGGAETKRLVSESPAPSEI